MASIIGSNPSVAPLGRFLPLAPDRETKIHAAMGEMDRAMIGFIFAVFMAISCMVLFSKHIEVLKNTWLVDVSGLWWVPYLGACFWSNVALRESRATWPQLHSGKSESIFLPSNLLLWAGILVLVWHALVQAGSTIAGLFNTDFPSRELISNEVFSNFIAASVAFPTLWAISCLLKMMETLQWIKVLKGQKIDEPPIQEQTLTTDAVPQRVSNDFERSPEES